MSPNENANETVLNAGTDAAGQAPSVELPGVAPAFVDELLSTIHEWIADSATGLGEVISDIASGAKPADVTAVVTDAASFIPV